MDDSTVVTLVVGVLMVVGLAGTLIPILPGLALMWIVALGYGLSVGFGGIGVTVMILLTALLLASVALGIALPKRAADTSGATRRSQIAGLLGAIVGFFVIPVAGVIVGALGGVLLAEYADKGELGPAWAATLGTAKGFGVTALVQFAIGFMMLIVWSAWAATVVF